MSSRARLLVVVYNMFKFSCLCIALVNKLKRVHIFALKVVGVSFSEGDAMQVLNTLGHWVDQ